MQKFSCPRSRERAAPSTSRGPFRGNIARDFKENAGNLVYNTVGRDGLVVYLEKEESE